MKPSSNSPDRGRRGLRHLPMIAWLWLLWILLWGSTGAVVLIGGLLVAVGVVLAFALPAVLPGAVPRPLRTARALVHLLTDLVGSGTTVAWQVVRHGRRTSSAIIEVPLHVDSDLLITAVAELTTMTPGTLVAEIDRRRKRLYVHALPIRDGHDITHRREEVQAVERRVARAVGHRHTADTHGSNPEPPDDTSRHIRRRKP
ncbi:Na+/H+ antiporter subunit E [Streptomyces sp. NPDC051243]|uniref:Na+/H+ antiporter subunit E n=1 Tax=Streptomyces sp. NPDC051243 TaxID=3365646 RepID=UPI00378F1233